jgi:hypothetical protein
MIGRVGTYRRPEPLASSMPSVASSDMPGARCLNTVTTICGFRYNKRSEMQRHGLGVEDGHAVDRAHRLAVLRCPNDHELKYCSTRRKDTLFTDIDKKIEAPLLDAIASLARATLGQASAIAGGAANRGARRP